MARELPARIRLRRTRGWRKPDDAVVVARPSRYGNPFRIGDPDPDDGHPMTRQDTVDRFARWLSTPRPTDHLREHARLRAALADGMLRGRPLACWCPLTDTRPTCHADVLLDLANVD